MSRLAKTDILCYRGWKVERRTYHTNASGSRFRFTIYGYPKINKSVPLIVQKGHEKYIAYRKRSYEFQMSWAYDIQFDGVKSRETGFEVCKTYIDLLYD